MTSDEGVEWARLFLLRVVENARGSCATQEIVDGFDRIEAVLAVCEPCARSCRRIH